MVYGKVDAYHAGFKNLVLITEMGYESMKNLEAYIAKDQKVITSVNVSDSDVLGKIRAIDMSRGFPQGMTIAPKDNLYYNPSKRDEKICDIQHAVSEQSAELDIMSRTKEPVADREDTIKRFSLLDITFNDDDTIKSYGVNQKKLDTMLLTAGFFASKTIGVDFAPPRRPSEKPTRD